MQRACHERQRFGCGGPTVGCGGAPYAATEIVLLALGVTVAEGVALGAGVLASSLAGGGGGCPYGCICVGAPHAAVASANNAARDDRASGDVVTSLACAPQNGHASPERT